MENIQVCVLGSAILIFLVIYVCIFSGLFTIESFVVQHPSETCSEWDGTPGGCSDQNHCEWDSDYEDSADENCKPRDPFAAVTPPDAVSELCKAYETKGMCRLARREWNRPCRWLQPWDKSDAERECLPNWADSSEFPVSDCNVKWGVNSGGSNSVGEKFWENNEYVKSSCGGQTEDDCDKGMWYKSNNNPAHGNCEWRGNKCRRRNHKNPRFNCMFRSESAESGIEHPVGGGSA